MANELAVLRVGDRALLGKRGVLRVVTVEKIGKIHITANGNKYLIRNGVPAGSDQYSASCLSVFDQARWDKFQQDSTDERMRDELRAFDWRSLTREHLAAAHAFIVPAKSVAQS